MGDRPRNDDPFEDLDQFFAPLEDEDWPEGGGTAPPADAGPPVDYPAPEPGDEGLAGLDELELDLPEERDLLGEPSAEEPAPTAGAAPPPPHAADRPSDAPPEVPGEAPAPTEPAATEGAPPGQEWDLETSEGAGEEWDRLRAEALAANAAESEGDEPTGEQPLSAEDLSAAPPQYADLPSPDAGDEPSGPVLEDPLTGTEAEPVDEGVFGREDTGVEVVGSATGPPETPADGPVDAEEPAGVEAAAERFAGAMRPEEVERELLADLGEGAGPETVRIEPTAPVATEPPAWEEEPAPEEAGPAAPAAAGGRNVTAAMVSGILLAAAVLALLAVGKGPFAVLVVLAVLLAQAELYAVMRTRGFQPATLLGLVCGGVMLGGAYLQGEGALLLGPALVVGLSVPWYMAVGQAARKHVVANTAATVFGVMYVPFLASFAMLILRAGDATGRNMFLVVLAVTVLYDVAAYAVGTIWGNRPLAPTISPHKSWEGAAGASLLVVLIGLAIVPNIDPFTAGTGTGLALLIALVAPLGDLVESALKRDFGVKDMGSLLPGHGGILDRIDAVLFVMPVAYFFLRIVLGG